MNSKRILAFILIGIMVLGFTACSKVTDTNVNKDVELKGISVIDDMGETVTLDQPAQRIISLYSAHTENLYHLGLGERIIGVGTSDIYPVDVLSKEVFDYKSDPEKIIAAEPDLVIVRPFINRKVPNFIESLKKAGVKVVSLYPEKYDEFDDYIFKLAKLTGTEVQAKIKLDEFYEEIEAVKVAMSDIKDKRRVYFESSENGYKTVTPESMPGLAIKNAGGINVAKDAKPYKEGSSIAEFGIESILSNAENIDVFVSQRGVMNAGGNYHSIVIRPGFDTIKAVKEDRIYIINQKLISSPTFRYAKGVREMARIIYPEIVDDITTFSSNEFVTRRDFAKMIVMSTGKSTYIPSSKYYRSKHKGHVYGMFEDITYMDKDFDMIETASMAGYMLPYFEGEKEYFKPEQLITRDELAQTLFMIGEYDKGEHIEIKDKDDIENLDCVEILISKGIMELRDGYFNPKANVTYNDLINILSK